MLIDHRCRFLSADRMLLLGSDRLRAPADSAGKARLLEQRLQPRLKVVVQIVHEDDPGAGNRATVGERRPVEFGVAIRADDCDKVHVIAGDVRNHVTEYAESRNYGWLVSGLERPAGDRARATRMTCTATATLARWIINAVPRR